MDKKREQSNRIRKSEAEKQWIANGRPVRYIKIPIKTDISLLEHICVEKGLIPDYALILLYKVLFARKTAKKEYRETSWFEEGYTTLSSKDLEKWIGRHYVAYIKMLTEICYLECKLSVNGGISYRNSDTHGLCARYRINPNLLQVFNADNLFGKLTNFRQHQLSDYKLINKLYLKHILNRQRFIVKHSHQLLADKLSKVKFRINNDTLEELTENYNDTIVGDMLSLMDSINSGDIYIKRELDEYGERFHSSLTFTWSSLRRYIYFEGSQDSVSYLDITNSQFYFFSQLTPALIATITPEFKHFSYFLEGVQEQADYRLFCSLCASGKVYEYIAHYFISGSIPFPIYENKQINYIDLSEHSDSRKKAKKFLMAVMFSNKGINQPFKNCFEKMFPSVCRLLRGITNNYKENFLPELLQKFESRVLLDRVAVELISTYGIEMLVTIHDGFLFNTADAEMVVAVVNEVFNSLSMSLPEYTIDLAEEI